MLLLWATLFNIQIISATEAITVDAQETIGKRQQILHFYQEARQFTVQFY